MSGTDSGTMRGQAGEAGGGGAAGGRLTGVGVGPGDPGLITVKGVEVLRAADRVFVPVGGTGELGYAERVVLAHLDADRVERLTFVLGDDPAARARAWDVAGGTVARVVAAGGHAAFATIGDPNLYSTFTYLAATVRQAVPAVEVETVPGITAMQDLAARSGTILAEGDQSLVLLPFATAGRGWPPGPAAGGGAIPEPDGGLVERLRRALDEHDTVVVYKAGRSLPAVRAALQEAGREGAAVFGARLGLDGEQVGPVPDGQAPYLSTVVVRRSPGSRGGRL